MFAVVGLPCAVAAAISVYLFVRATFFGGNEMLPLYAAVALSLAGAVLGVLGMWRARQHEDDLVTAMLAITVVIACLEGLVLLVMVVAEANSP